MCVHMRHPGDNLSCYPQLLSSSFFERVSFTGLELTDCRQGWLTTGKAVSLETGSLIEDEGVSLETGWLTAGEDGSLLARLTHWRQGWFTAGKAVSTAGKTVWPVNPKQLLVIFMVCVTQVCYHQAQLFWEMTQSPRLHSILPASYHPSDK